MSESPADTAPIEGAETPAEGAQQSSPEVAPQSAAVARLDDRRPGSVTHRARGQFDRGQMDLIRATVAKECNDAELAMFLELCARYELDPFAKQIWAAKMSGGVQIIVSRDGLIALGDRHPDYGGYDADVIRKHDHFHFKRVDNLPVVEHEYRDKDGHPSGDPEQRGPIVAMWCIAYREGRRPAYIYASFAEYNSGKNVWASYPSAMALKVVEGIAHKRLFSISGVLAEGEESRIAATDRTALPDEPVYGDDPAVAARLRALMDALEWVPRKRQVTLAPLHDDDARVALIHRLEAECEQRGLTVDPTAAEEAAGEEVDAEVIGAA